MSLDHATLAAVGLALIALAVPLLGLRRTLFFLLVLSVTVGPKALSRPTGPRYVGIASAMPTYYTFTLFGAVLLLALALSDTRGVLRGLRIWLPFIAADIYAGQYLWPRDSLAASGQLQLLSGIACFVVGYAAVEANILKESDLPRLFYVVVCVEAATVAMSLLGHPLLHAHGPQAADVAGRAIGTAGHPDQLAKLMLVGIGVMLSYRPQSSAEARVQQLGLITSVGIIALTLGRAAFVGAVIGVVTYILLEPQRRIRRRHLGVALAVAAAACASGAAFIGRFQHDPSQGVRTRLTAVALRAIHMRPWSGVGPNHYVDSVGRWDALTASGVPVHNVFLLSAAELGVVVAALLWLPIAVLVFRAIRNVRSDDRRGVAARATLALVPGLLLTGLTGWGLFQEPTFEVLGLVCGVWLSRLTSEAPVRAPVHGTQLATP